MRPRLIIDLPSHDPDVALIVAWLRRVPVRRRSQAIRQVLALGIRWIMHRTAGRRRPDKASRENGPATVSPPAAEARTRATGLATGAGTRTTERPHETGTATDTRMTAVAHRFRIPLLTGGIRYDDPESAPDRTASEP
jgi:hypothetical protein